ncbi:MAG: LytTR family transcriptional regulator [Spiribacter salinus]|uniref:LytTR family transcriptional regulator n=1 Tax=Spiribacter salinus TaxID=1335746 RepID=A0A540VSF0_9GAMM|nr:MAG: LytTR family transcriptional regulator [Spiribacter salinus]
MNGAGLSFTMRERLRQMAWLLGPPAGVGIVLGLLGPFGTFQALAWPARITYWFSIVVVNWMLCDLAVRRLDAWLADSLPARPLLVPLLGGALAAIPATGVVHAAGSIAGLSGEGMLSLFWKVLLVCAVLSVVFYLNAPDDPDTTNDPGPDSAAQMNRSEQPDVMGSLFFQRLERPITGELLCLQMQDHYLAVHDTDGQQLILCRMEDAARELDSLGQRVHRSWWVAHDAVDQIKRRNGRMSLRLKDGREVPVGRTYQHAVAAAEPPSPAP